MEKNENTLFEINRGSVLNLFAEVECWLDDLFSLYFTKGLPETKGKILANLLYELTFEEKRQLFQKICSKEGFTKNALFKPGMDAISNIQKVRNMVAHCRKYRPPEGGIKTKLGHSGKTEGSELKLNTALINDLSRKCHDATLAIGMLMNKLQ